VDESDLAMLKGCVIQIDIVKV
jgi:hypothetical protein